jgi:hypothetical protein
VEYKPWAEEIKDARRKAQETISTKGSVSRAVVLVLVGGTKQFAVGTMSSFVFFSIPIENF